MRQVDQEDRERLEHAISAFIERAHISTYSEASQHVRQIAKAVCRRKGLPTEDGRTRAYVVEGVEVWDISRGLHDPVTHEILVPTEQSFTGLKAALAFVSDTLKTYFEKSDKLTPEECYPRAIMGRSRSFRSQLYENNGRSAFRVRWTGGDKIAYMATAVVRRER